MRILIANLYSALNRGDYLIALGTIEILRRTYGDPELSGMVTSRTASLVYLEPDTRPYAIVLRSVEGNPSGLIQSPAESSAQSSIARVLTLVMGMTRAGVTLLRARTRSRNELGRPDPSVAHLQDFDLVINVGGAYLDASTLKDYPLLLSHLYPSGLAYLAGVPYAFVGESISGVDQAWARWPLRIAFSRASLVVFREEISLAKARESRLLGVSGPPPTSVLPDLALGLAESLRPFRSPRSKRSPVTVGVAFRMWSASRVNRLDGDPVSPVAHALAQAAHEIPMRFVLLPFSRITSSNTDNDALACGRLEEELRRIDPALEVSTVTLPPPENLEGLARAFQGLDFAVCVRLHASIFAAMVGVPSVVVEYRGHKSRGITEYLGLGDYYLGSVSTGELKRKVVDLARNYDRVSLRVIDEVERSYRRLTGELIPSLREIPTPNH